jgi:hypothetical protein
MYAGYLALKWVLWSVGAFGSVETSWLFADLTASLEVGRVAIVMAWVFLAWKGIPASHRGTMTPGRAAFTLFIPLYDVYWAFVMNVALCDTLDGILTSAQSSKRAPRTLGIVASTAWLGVIALEFAFAVTGPRSTIPAVSLTIVSESLWLAYMILCDRAREEVARLGGDLSALGTPRLSRIQRKKGPHPVAAVALAIIAIVGFLGCWQVLQPSERVPLSSPSRVQRR